MLSKQEEDLVAPMARAAAHISPKYVYAEEQFVCLTSGDCFAAVVKDYLDGTFKGSQSEKESGIANRDSVGVCKLSETPGLV